MGPKMQCCSGSMVLEATKAKLGNAEGGGGGEHEVLGVELEASCGPVC